MPRKKTTRPGVKNYMAAPIAPRHTIEARIETLGQLAERRAKANGDLTALRQIAEEYRTLGAVQTAAEILKEC